MSGHTPGPWFVTGSMTKYVEARIGGGMLQEVAACGPTEADGGYGETQTANANLIAAAPDLLSVAIQARAAMITVFNDPATSEDAKELIERKCEYLSAAIARAKGEE